MYGTITLSDGTVISRSHIVAVEPVRAADLFQIVTSCGEKKSEHARFRTEFISALEAHTGPGYSRREILRLLNDLFSTLGITRIRREDRLLCDVVGMLEAEGLISKGDVGVID